MELRSRSRSITPFQSELFIQGEVLESATVTRSTRRSTAIRSHTHTDVSKSVVGKGKSRVRHSLAAVKTSDYSSEEQESEDFAHISDNQKNRIIQDAKAAANGTTEVSALGLYRRAGNYWDKYPKTDYTYSPHSRDRVEIAPGVVQMPNMSRRTIHSSTNTDYDYYSAHSAKQRLFGSNNANNNGQDETTTYNVRTTTSTMSLFTRIYTLLVTYMYAVYSVQNSGMLYLAKKVHRLTSRWMLFDTWLLKRTEQRNGKVGRVVALCLVPLVVFAAWWCVSSLGTAASTYFTSPSPYYAPPSPTEHTHPPLPLPQQPPPLQTPPPSPALPPDALLAHLLQTPQIATLITNYHTLKTETTHTTHHLEKTIETLQSEIAAVKAQMVSAQTPPDFHRLISAYHSENRRSLNHLTNRLARCCAKPSPLVSLEPLIAQVVGRLLNDPAYLSNQAGLTQWLHALFVAKHDLEGHLANLTQGLSKEFDASLEVTAQLVMEKVAVKLTAGRDPLDLDGGRIRGIVKEALVKYDADKTGLVDYAMEPMGGEVVTTRCTETYHSGTAVVSIWGVPLWYPNNSPRTVITPGIHPGECWAFQNFPGFLVVKLANRIRVDAFSLEHVSRLLVPDGRIDSAPKEFEVYGLQSESDKEPVKIGDYVYEYDGDAVQFFAAQLRDFEVSLVELRIRSNHGNPNYTCLYRFRVHGGGKVT